MFVVVQGLGFARFILVSMPFHVIYFGQNIICQKKYKNQQQFAWQSFAGGVCREVCE